MNTIVVYITKGFSAKPRVTVVKDMFGFKEWCKQFGVVRFWVIDPDNPTEVEFATVEHTIEIKYREE